MFKQRKNKKFNYKPRFSKESQLEEHSKGHNLASKWQKQRDASLGKGRRGFPMRTLIIILVLLLICMYVLENKFM
ncbi:hypothetical protein [Pontimicrobium aquaticum]|uniref:Uncharacterized protein n=1 Tax=Pontimicrobium aquaticum TaxID=2565367 RepID=A0A4V5LQZ2_9FLAO|nr:hypothetical protein [Pontimicrobium aquaticum]TJY36269.1 hypothetical protein E5167_06270 [Pontimicrobium aquaticum]